ncbi:hypothetical protein Poli38472_013542 [Pythium oligandrum]|uniref:Crinkler (CRN) family protein n=1 Tax=Pythium oligandrum TaxID=41045 RepID=A0A8K1C7Y4_PYTOL|nr:hypothetical protein Poli38472_013542 [Pythium oligandrum]|eukprot:TMW58068.1 hypothetical protein Poli38472_013542 [Pythium oligandrum]
MRTVWFALVLDDKLVTSSHVQLPEHAEVADLRKAVLAKWFDTMDDMDIQVFATHADLGANKPPLKFWEPLTGLGKRLVAALALHLRQLDPVDPYVVTFEQRKDALAYLRTQLKPLLDKPGFALVDISKDNEILKARDPRLSSPLAMKADAMLVYRPTPPSPSSSDKLEGVRMLIQFKTQATERHIPEADMVLICCGLNAPRTCCPMVLLTDLSDTWHFRWFSQPGRFTETTITSSTDAVEFIMAAAAKEHGAFHVDRAHQTVHKFPYVDTQDN